jgi:biopolymer transport protein ExbD
VARKNRRGSRTNVMVPVASMGDIAFLLIIFFIITSDFIKMRQADVALPRNPEIKEIEKASPIVVAYDTDGRIYVDGRQIPGADAVESEVNSVLVSRFGDRTENYKVLFQCDRDHVGNDFEPIIKGIAAAGAQLQMAGREDR